jgi:hypothetical protein
MLTPRNYEIIVPELETASRIREISVTALSCGGHAAAGVKNPDRKL